MKTMLSGSILPVTNEMAVILVNKLLSSIGVWGDSLLAGVVLDEKAGRYSILENNAAASLAKKIGVTIRNNSKFGCTAPKGMKFLTRALEMDTEFSAAILEYGGNDCDFDWAQVAAAPEEEHIPKTPLDEFFRCYADMIACIRAKGIEPVLVSLPPLDAERYFDWITRNGLSRENILSWLGDVQHIYRWHERYSNAVSSLARKYNCHFIDIRDAFLSVHRPGELMCADGIHPNQKGHALMEKVFLEYAEQFIQ